MQIVFIIALLMAVGCEEQMLVTKAYTDYVRRHVSWKVVDYEDNIFRGWTVAEAAQLLGTIQPPVADTPLPIFETAEPVPAAIDWRGNCVHEVRNQNSCGSCWTFGTAGMLSDRCCLHVNDHGWLSPQELVSCDIRNDGCSGGWPAWALQYVLDNGGLVPEACFPYEGSNTNCPTKCTDGSDWRKAHICACHGLKQCLGVDGLKGCLKSGPVAVTFEICTSFFVYRSGIYKCDCTNGENRLHTVTAVGYSDTPECHWIVRNSWSDWWGEKGYFRMAYNSCGMNGKYPNGNAMCETVG